MLLTTKPVWECGAKPSLKFFQKHFAVNSINPDALFNETFLLVQYVLDVILMKKKFDLKRQLLVSEM